MKHWSTEFPTTTGWYWFHGYRFGKVSCGAEQEPELCAVKVAECSNGFMFVADGNFMYPSEVEEPHFMPMGVPSSFPDYK